MEDPLAHVAVLELGAGTAVAYAGKLLADMGAEVVKVEPPEGDASRYQGPYAGDVFNRERSGTFAYLNAGKRSVVIDADTDDGRLRLGQLLSSSRVVLHSWPDAALAAHRLTTHRLTAYRLMAHQIAEDYPAATVVNITAFGAHGDVNGPPANDLTLQAIGAISQGIGSRGRPPLKLPGDQSAYQAGLCAAIAAAGNLLCGTGVQIDVAAADVWATFYNGGDVANEHFGRKKQPRAGYRVSRQPYLRAIFPCQDGFFAIQCTETRHWLAFLKMVGQEELASHPLFANRLKANDEHGEQCDAFFTPWFGARTKEELLTLCLENKLPGAPVYDFGEIVEHAHLRTREYFDMTEMDGVPLRIPTHPFKGIHTAAQRVRCPPRLGEHPGYGPVLQQPDAARDAASDPLRPLTGIRVVDCGWVWAGAIPGHILADLGAEVIRVESRRPLDFMRQGRPIFGKEKDPEQNPVFQNVNRGKLSLCINLAEPGAADVLRQLAAKSDVVIENFSPGVMDRFGLGWADLKAVRSDLIMCSMSAAGQHGPLSGIRTYAAMIAGLAGINSMAGYRGERVLGIHAPPYADPNAGLHAAFAILAALNGRRMSGQGVYIDLSQWEAAVNVMGAQVMDYVMNGRVAGTSGTRDTAHAPYGHYPVQGEDRWIAIAVTNDEHWRALRQVLGDPAWMRAPALAAAAQRLEQGEALDRQLSHETAIRDGVALVSALIAAGVPASLLLEVSEILAHPYFEARALFEMVEHPTLKRVPVYRLPWRIDDAPIPVLRRAPMLGEHSDHVLHALLGKSADEIADLRARRIIE